MLRRLLINLAPEDAGTAGGKGSESDGKDITGTSGSDNKDGKGSTGTSGKEGSEEKDITASGTEGKDKKGEGETEKVEKPPADFKLKLPEGVDEKTAAPYIEIAKKHGLKAEAAQAYYDLASKAADEKVSALETDIKSTWEKTHTGWLEEAKKDPEIGGDKFKESIALANKAVRLLGGNKFADVLIDSKLGRHPEVIRALAKAGRAISEDSIAGLSGKKGEAAPTSEKARLRAQFPNSPGMWQHLPD